MCRQLMATVRQQLAANEAPVIHPFHSLTYPITAREQLDIAVGMARVESTGPDTDTAASTVCPCSMSKITIVAYRFVRLFVARSVCRVVHDDCVLAI